MPSSSRNSTPIYAPIATPESRAESFHTAQSLNSRRSLSTVGSAPDTEVLALFMVDLGIEAWEEDEFGWIAEVGLLTALPCRWASCHDPDSGSLYFVDPDTQ